MPWIGNEFAITFEIIFNMALAANKCTASPAAMPIHSDYIFQTDCPFAIVRYLQTAATDNWSQQEQRCHLKMPAVWHEDASIPARGNRCRPPDAKQVFLLLHTALRRRSQNLFVFEPRSRNPECRPLYPFGDMPVLSKNGIADTPRSA